MAVTCSRYLTLDIISTFNSPTFDVCHDIFVFNFSMKLFFFIFFMCLLIVCRSRDCKCGIGYIPHDDHGETKCYGLLTQTIESCNMTEEEPCKCTNASGVVHNDEGRWCAKFGNGVTDQKWPCEK